MDYFAENVLLLVHGESRIGSSCNRTRVPGGCSYLVQVPIPLHHRQNEYEYQILYSTGKVLYPYQVQYQYITVLVLVPQVVYCSFVPVGSLERTAAVAARSRWLGVVGRRGRPRVGC